MRSICRRPGSSGRVAKQTRRDGMLVVAWTSRSENADIRKVRAGQSGTIDLTIISAIPALTSYEGTTDLAISPAKSLMLFATKYALLQAGSAYSSQGINRTWPW